MVIARRKFYFWMGLAGLLLIGAQAMPSAHCEESSRTVSNTKSVGLMSAGEKRSALEDARINRRWVLLGAHGELYAPVRDIWPPMGDLLIVPVGDELELVAYYDMSEVAKVKSNGNIEINKSTTQLQETNNFPQKWPRDRKKKLLLTLPLGTVLQSERPKKQKDSLAPSGAIGWVVPMYEDCIFMPKQDGVRPRDFLWIVPEADSGFRMIHGDPARNGMYLSVAPDRKITYGEDSNGIETRAEGQRYWSDIFYEDGKQVPFSEGCVSSARGAQDPHEVYIFKNGLLDSSSGPTVY